MQNEKENKETNPKKGFLGIMPVLIAIAVTCMVTINVSVKQDSFAQGQSMDNQTLGNVSIPISTGFIDGKIAYFIATDASTQEVASSVSNTTGFKVNYAPTLANTSESARQQGFVFLNGFSGEEGGPLGSQLSVATAIPGDPDYSPLFDINYVRWNTNNTSDIRILKSAEEIFEAQQNGELTITKSNVVINSPAIVK
ncbi:MAG: hypothetical protein WBX01_02870 [Nitrososphaeraceae archaeon]|jgi:hypothetical protein